jgi:hypothetical protein
MDSNTISPNLRTVATIAKWIPEFGKTADSAENVESQWFVMDIIPREDFFDNMEEVTDTLNFYKKNYNGNKDHIKLSLIEPVLLPTQEMIAIDYTYYIRLIQRLWRKNRKNRKI